MAQIETGIMALAGPYDASIRCGGWTRPCQAPNICTYPSSDTTRRLLMSQGRIAVQNNKTVDGEMTAEEFLNQWNSQGGQNQSAQALNYYAGNVRGTQQYLVLDCKKERVCSNDIGYCRGEHARSNWISLQHSIEETHLKQ